MIFIHSRCNNLLSNLFFFFFPVLYFLCQSQSPPTNSNPRFLVTGKDTSSNTEDLLDFNTRNTFRYHTVRRLLMLIRESPDFTIISKYTAAPKLRRDRRGHHSNLTNPYPVSRNPVPVSSGSALRTPYPFCSAPVPTQVICTCMEL